MTTAESEREDTEFDDAAREAIELGNRLQEDGRDADLYDVASGVLAGAVQFWLYSRQPCEDPTCDSCDDVRTADQRMQLMLEEIKQFAEESDYFHSPNDSNVGTA